VVPHRITTVENIAAYAWQRLQGKFGQARLAKVTVWETDKHIAATRRRTLRLSPISRCNTGLMKWLAAVDLTHARRGHFSRYFFCVPILMTTAESEHSPDSDGQTTV